MSDQYDLEFLILEPDPVGEQTKILERFIAQILRFIDHDCGATILQSIRNDLLELPDKLKLPALIGRHTELRQYHAHDFLEAQPRVGYASEPQPGQPARADRIEQRGLACAGLAEQQHEPALIVQQRPFKRGQTLAMRRAHEKRRRRGREPKRRALETEVFVIHRGYTRSFRIATIGNPVRSFTTEDE